MRFLTLFLLMMLGAAAPAVAQTERMPDVETPGSWQGGTWRDPDLGRAIFEGYADHASLWLRGESGKVVRFDRTDGTRTVVAESVLDLMPDGTRLWVLTSGAGHEAEIRDLRSEQSEPVRFYARETPMISLFATGQDRPGVLTGAAAYRPAERGWDRRELAATLAAGKVVSDGQTSLYVGLNRGEFGGGLRRVDLDTGTISIVSAQGDGLCGGALSPACQPVVGLFPVPDRPGCVIVGTGLSHLGLSMGHVYRVCRDGISSEFNTPTPTLPDRWMLMPSPWPLDDLVPIRDGWVATSRGRFFRSRDGRVEEQALKPFHDWSDLRISDEQDGVLFVVGSCCWGVADKPTLFRALPVPVLD